MVVTILPSKFIDSNVTFWDINLSITWFTSLSISICSACFIRFKNVIAKGLSIDVKIDIKTREAHLKTYGI